MAIVMSTTIMAITTISSTKVNPRARSGLLACLRASARSLSERGTIACQVITGRLPLRIWRTIGGLLESLSINVENVLPAPTRGLRIILVAAQTPFGRAGERVARDTPQQVHLLFLGAGQ